MVPDMAALLGAEMISPTLLLLLITKFVEFPDAVLRMMIQLDVPTRIPMPLSST